MERLKLENKDYLDICVWYKIKTSGFSYVTLKEIQAFVDSFDKIFNTYNVLHNVYAKNYGNFKRQLKKDCLALNFKGGRYYGIKNNLFPRVKDTVDSLPSGAKKVLTKMIDLKKKNLSEDQLLKLDEKSKKFIKKFERQSPEENIEV